MAQGLAAAGAQIVVAARNREKSRAAATEIERRGGTAIAIDVDVTGEASVDAMTKATMERLGRLDILRNNAGTHIRKAVPDPAPDRWGLAPGPNMDSGLPCPPAAVPAREQA